MSEDYKKKHEIVDIAIDCFVPSADNPNEQGDKEFNMLCDDIQKNGFVEPVQVVRKKDEEGKYTIVGGEHRWRAARLLGFETIPAIVMPDTFTDDQRKVQLVRWNIIKGKLNPIKFTNLFNDLSKRYEPEMLKLMMAFTDEQAFDAVYQQSRKALPQELRQKLDDVKDEIKTIDELSQTLNTLFTKYGSTLEYSFMVFAYGGKTHYMIRMDSKTKKNMDTIAGICVEKKEDINDAINKLIGNYEEEVKKETEELLPVQALENEVDEQVEEQGDVKAEGVREGEKAYELSEEERPRI